MTALERLAELWVNLEHLESLLRTRDIDEVTETVRALGGLERFSPELIAQLEPLPGFRNVVIHEYVELDDARVIEALARLQSIRDFVRIAVDELGSSMIRPWWSFTVPATVPVVITGWPR